MYVGPFKVVRAVGRNAFKLDLPVALRVHPVFNVSLLRRYTGDRMLPAPVAIDDKIEYVVDRIVRHRGRPKHYQYLVRGRGMTRAKICGCLSQSSATRLRYYNSTRRRKAYDGQGSPAGE